MLSSFFEGLLSCLGPRSGAKHPLLRSYEGTAFHPLEGLVVGPAQDIVLQFRINGKLEGCFEADGRRLEFRRLGASGSFTDVLRWFAIEYGISQQAEKRYPYVLTRDAQGWALDIDAGAHSYRCWFDCEGMLFFYQRIKPEEARPRVKGPRLVGTYPVASTADGTLALEARFFERNGFYAELRCQGRGFSTVVETGDVPPAPPAERISGWFLYRWVVEEGQTATLERTESGRWFCRLGPAEDWAALQETWGIEIDLPKDEVRMLDLGLGRGRLFRSSDSATEIQGRFRRGRLGKEEVELLYQGQPLTVRHQNLSISVGNSGRSVNRTDTGGTWFGLQGSIGSELYGLCKRGEVLELVPQEPGQFAVRGSNKGSCGSDTFESSFNFHFTLPELRVELESSSTIDTSM